MRFFATITIAALALVALTVIATAPAANAQTFYTDLASFNAAATTDTTYNFNGIAPPGSFTTNPAVLTRAASGRVTFSVTGGSDPIVYAVSRTLSSGSFALSDGTDSVLAGFPAFSATVTTIALDGSYTAFAIDYGMESNGTNSFSFALFNGVTPVGNANPVPSLGGDRFFGVTSDTAFSSVRVTAAINRSFRVVFDNVRVGSASIAVVPESGTVALPLPALGILGTVVIRRRRAA